MSNRGKQFRALSPKKVSRRKRTPRCETCGKRDGEDLGGEGQGKVRLKLCARCRGVAYCGMECQKLGWKVHREVCVQYANAAELPPPSPLVNQKVSGTGTRGRRKVIYGGAVGTVGATPRQRENAPTRHPFFGRQESSSERDPRVAAGQHAGAKALPVRKQKEQDLPQRTPRRHQQQAPPPPPPPREQQANEEDGCPSPPVMQRLSFPGGISRTRQGSRSSSAGGDSKSPPPAQQHPPGSRGSVAGAVKTAALRVRRSSHAAETDARWGGSLSPPPPPPPSRPANGGPVRRESAPLYPVALEKSKRRAASLTPSSAAEAIRRGPPPPYASVAHRAESIKRATPSTAVGTSANGEPGMTSGGAAAGSVTKAAEGIIVGAPPAELPSRRSSSSAVGPPTARVPPRLPPRTAVSSPPRHPPADQPPADTAQISPPASREKEVKPVRGGHDELTAAKDEDTDAPEKSPPFDKETLARQMRPWIDGPQLPKREEDGKEIVAELREEEDTDEPTPERRAGGAPSEGVFDASQGVDAPSLAKESTQDSAASSTAAQEAADTTAAPLRPSLSKESSQNLSQDSAAGSTTGQASTGQEDGSSTDPLRLSLSKYSTGSLSQDSAAASTTGQEGWAPPSLAKDSAKGFSRDSATAATAGHDDGSSGAPVQPPPLAKHAEASISDDCMAGSTVAHEGGSSAPVPPSLAKDAAGSMSYDSAAGSTAGHEASSSASVQRKDSTGSCSHDSAAGSTASEEGESRLPMEPPPPILPPSATSNTNSSLAKASNDGVFDSCPPSAGTGSKSGSRSPRSLSVGTSPQFHSMPLMLAAKGIASAAAATWNAERRKSPRPRPPVSPGPAALSDSFRSRKQSATEPPDDLILPKISPSAAATTAAIVSFGREKSLASPSARSLSTGSRRASPRSGMATPRSPPFVPAVELSPQGKLQTSPRVPGPRPTDTAVFYQERLGASPAGAAGLPPPSRTYLGRPEGFSVHVLVASAPTRADLTSRGADLPAGGGAGKDVDSPRLHYSFEDRGRVAAALQPGDVVLVTPGRYEARAWGLQRLIASVEIVGAGAAGDCVIYNDPPASQSGPAREHYLVGVMGGAAGGAGGGGASVPEVKGKDDIDDDSDSGFEDGAFGGAASSIASFGGRRAVRVRLANLTLEQGSGYRGAVYQLGRESHLEMEGCTVVCSQGGVNIDQGTCAISDSTISGSEAFGVHIGGEGAVEHCLIRNCGRGGGGARAETFPLSAEGATAPAEVEVEDDGTVVNRIEGMPAISFLQSSRVRVRFNVIRDNAGHALQCRDAPLPGGDGKYAMLARRAEAEAEEKLRSWLGSAAVLLREHLQDQHREGSVVSEGNQRKLNRGCNRAGCGGTGTGTGRGRGGTAAAPEGAFTACPPAGEVSQETRERAVSAAGAEGSGDGGSVSRETGEAGSPVSRGGDRGSGVGAGAGQTCIPTAEEEGIPLPAAMTLRFLAAMDDGYIGSRREENARLRRTRMRHERAG
eukprot:g5566.t1